MRSALDALLALPEIAGPVGYSGGVIAIGIRLSVVEPRIAAAGLFAGSFVPRSMFAEAREITIPLHVLLQWDDEGNDRQLALDLFDAFGSKEKTLQANMGGHRACRRSPARTRPGSSPGICAPLLPRVRSPYARRPCPSRRRGGRGHWLRSSVVGSVQRMAIKLENVGIAVRDLDETIAFFTDLGLTVIGRDTVSGEWTDTAVGLDGNHARIAMLQTPDGQGQIELFEYIHPEAIETDPTLPNEIGMHRVAFSVDDIDEALEIAARHGCRPLRGVGTYQDIYKLTYVRGPSGIIVMLAEELKKGAA